jgi:hypothetical protein
VAPKIFPGREVTVVILTAALKKMGVIAYEHGGDPGPFEVPGDRRLPELDGAPGPPEEILNPAEHVVPRRHAGERPYLVLVEDECVLSEGIEVRGIEFLSPIGPQQMSIKAIKDY